MLRNISGSGRISFSSFFPILGFGSVLCGIIAHYDAKHLECRALFNVPDDELFLWRCMWLAKQSRKQSLESLLVGSHGSYLKRYKRWVGFRIPWRVWDWRKKELCRLLFLLVRKEGSVHVRKLYHDEDKTLLRHLSDGVWDQSLPSSMTLQSSLDFSHFRIPSHCFWWTFWGILPKEKFS